MRTTPRICAVRGSSAGQGDGRCRPGCEPRAAIVVGKQNLPEFAARATPPTALRTTRNRGRWTGAGDRAAARRPWWAAGMVPIATATDGGGRYVSRQPSAASSGSSPPRRDRPLPAPDWIDFSTDGPFATTVADLRLLMSIESGPSRGRPHAPPRLEQGPVKRPAKVFASARLSGSGELPDAVAAAFDAAPGVESAGKVFGISIKRLEPEALWPDGGPEDEWVVLASVEHVHRLVVISSEPAWDRYRIHRAKLHGFVLGFEIDTYIEARRRPFRFREAVRRAAWR